VYDNSAADMTMYQPSEAILLLNKIECDVINATEGHENLERQKNKFKWICCDAVLVSGNIGGCKKGKHGFNITETGELDQGRLADTTMNPLDQAMIQWEAACRANEEYNNKWLKLLQVRD
jgi:hypothetical protein